MMQMWALSTNVTAMQEDEFQLDKNKILKSNYKHNTKKSISFSQTEIMLISVWCDVCTNYLQVTFAFVWKLKGKNTPALFFNL